MKNSPKSRHENSIDVIKYTSVVTWVKKMKEGEVIFLVFDIVSRSHDGAIDSVVEYVIDKCNVMSKRRGLTL